VEDSKMSKEFTFDDLCKMVELGGRALEAQDRFISGCFERNPAYCNSNEIPGIKVPSLCDERFYQRVVYLSLLSSFPYFVKLEYGPSQFDIAIFDSPTGAHIGLGEMKKAMAPGLAEDVGEIKAAIEKLRQRRECGQFLLIFAVARKDYEPGGWRGWVEELLKSSGCAERKHHEYAFDTANDTCRTSGRHGWVFAVIGVLLAAAPAGVGRAAE
jgi:hypothetical protein